jgi:NADPH-dependent curcumin reductase CurA
MPVNRRYLLIRRPRGTPLPEDFALVSEPVPLPGPGELVIRNHYASLDPAQRGWMDDAPSYAPPIPLGDPVRAATVGVIHASADARFHPGEWVVGVNGIEDYSRVPALHPLRRVDVSRMPSPSNFLSGIGAVGLTGYFGLLEVGRPEAGDTVLVSGAAGAVGSVVGQIAKLRGCHTVGIAGGQEKCRRIRERYGFDVAIDYVGKSITQLATEIGTAAPNGIDILFENVGGDVLDASLLNLALHARIVLCGLISEYNSDHGRIGARNLWELIVKRATVQGFLVRDYADRFEEAGAQVAAWIAEGKLRIDEHVVDGIERAYDAFMMLFRGTNQGKMILRLNQ